MQELLVPDRATDAYAELAPVYDAFTEGHNHERWMGLLESLAVENGLRGRRVLDVACGTGSSFLPLLARGYEVVGCDLSPDMVARAREKVQCHGARAEVFVADMRALPELGSFDLVTCIDDALNNLLSLDQLRSALEGFARNLRPGGLAIFDSNTLHAYRVWYAGTNAKDGDGSFFCIRGETADDVRPGGTASVCIEVFTEREDGLWERAQSRHLQRHHPRDDVVRAVEEAGLELLAIRGLGRGLQLTLEADEELDTKFVYLVRKPEPNGPAKRGVT
jgi:SAM-dependent methyltransferase